jgi:Secretion system C-terminal sorting domain
LESLTLTSNQLSGSIPNFNLSRLNRLYLDENQLSGNIPDFKLPNLTIIYFANNQLGGHIPDFKLANLRYLTLRGNKLTGRIPLFDSTKLVFIDLARNQLSDKIPNFNLHKLSSLYLASNLLTDCIPKEIKINCPLIGTNGEIYDNPKLATYDWAKYWNNGEGACRAEIVDMKLLMYPNPTKGDVKMDIRIVSTGLYRVEIFDVAGRNVLEQNTNLIYTDNTFAVPTSRLPRGLYVVRISKGDQIIRQKLVVD